MVGAETDSALGAIALGGRRRPEAWAPGPAFGKQCAHNPANRNGTGVVKTLRSKYLEAAIDETSLTVEVRDRCDGTVWRMQGDGPGDIGLKDHCGPWQGMAFNSAKDRKWEWGESEAKELPEIPA